MPVAKEQIRQIISENNSSVADVNALLKDSFKDILQELMEAELEVLKEKWEKKYPYAISNWENNWEDVRSFFPFSGDIRRIMYTTNIIEGLNRQYRKVTETKSVFPSDVSLIFSPSKGINPKG